MIVRRCTVEDFPQILGMVKEFMDSALKDFGAELGKEALKNLMLELQPTSLVLVRDGKTVGVLAGKVITEPTGGRKIFQETIWYVLKAHRKHGLLLIKAREQWCKREGITAIIMGHMGNSMPDKVRRLYKRMGFRHMECHYIRVLN